MGKAGCTGKQTQNNGVAASEKKAESEEEEKIMRHSAKTLKSENCGNEALSGFSTSSKETHTNALIKILL